MKQCNKCKLNKPFTDFGLHIKYKDGYQPTCKECRAINYQKTKQKRLEYQNKYNTENRPKVRANNKLWRSNNPDKAREHAAFRRALKLKATPQWLTKADRKAIRSFYKLAKDLTEVLQVQHEVDHIIPLNGAAVCGLHVPWNLQVLTAEANNKKNASLLDDVMEYVPEVLPQDTLP